MWKMPRSPSKTDRTMSQSPPVELFLCLIKHKVTDTCGAVEVKLQEFLFWATDPDGQLYNPVALCAENNCIWGAVSYGASLGSVWNSTIYSTVGNRSWFVGRSTRCTNPILSVLLIMDDREWKLCWDRREIRELLLGKKFVRRDEWVNSGNKGR
jgi:hypothetical protein